MHAMSCKRPPSPALIPNPFLKKRNTQWTLESPSSSTARDQQGSPGSKDPDDYDDDDAHHTSPPPKPSIAAVEAGEAFIDDHLEHFTTHLQNHILPPQTLGLPHGIPLLPIPSYASLYQQNAHSRHGAHFVIHQHDHPVAGTHYDLRLQINETSSASWAVMYGLPGDPNSVRLNRNAAETRVHCLWVSYSYTFTWWTSFF
jgi:hypothetical protein